MAHGRSRAEARQPPRATAALRERSRRAGRVGAGFQRRRGDASFGGLREALFLMASVAVRFATRTLVIPRLDTRNSTIGVSNQPAF